jgi:pyridoxine 5-phosphate synthase
MNWHIRLGVNIDHVATLRNARGGRHPDPVRAAQEAIAAGADGITAHLREDRRHIRDADIARLKAEIAAPLNLEMAATEEMTAIACRTKPHAACIVPERREEITTEGGLDAAGAMSHLLPIMSRLADAGIRVSLFIDAEERQIEAAVKLGAPVIELHTGRWCEAAGAAYGAMTSREQAEAEFARLAKAAKLAHDAGLEVHGGHGLDYETAARLSALPQIRELNIGHFLVGEAVFLGFHAAIARMRAAMSAGVRAA